MIFRDQVARRPGELAVVDSRGKTALCGLAPHRLNWAALDALVDRHWLAMSSAPQDGPELTADDVILNPVPLVDVASIAGTLLPWLRVGATYVLHHPFTLPTFVRQLADERFTYTIAPPPVLALLLHNEELLRDLDLRSLRAVASGSAPLSPSMVRGWQERYKLPERFVFVDRLPRDPVGKVTKRTLRERLPAGGLAAEFA